MGPSRDGFRVALGRRPAGWVAATAFAAEAERIVDALCRMRLRASLYVLRFEGRSPESASRLAEEALGDIGLVGRLPDRSIGLLLIDGAASRAARRACLAQRIVERLQANPPAADGVRLRLAERHGWTDELAGAAQIVEELMDTPAAVLPLPARLNG